MTTRRIIGQLILLVVVIPGQKPNPVERYFGERLFNSGLTSVLSPTDQRLN